MTRVKARCNDSTYKEVDTYVLTRITLCDAEDLRLGLRTMNRQTMYSNDCDHGGLSAHL
jgi:hypothetical protein